MQRITDRDVHNQFMLLNRVLASRGVQEAVSFHRGNSSYKVNNMLLVGQTNVWPDGMAGTTAKDAYNALRLTLSAIHNFSNEEN